MVWDSGYWMLDAGYSILKKAGVHGFKGLPAFGSAIGEQGSRFHFRSRTAFGTCIYKKNGKRLQVLHMCVLRATSYNSLACRCGASERLPAFYPVPQCKEMHGKYGCQKPGDP